MSIWDDTPLLPSAFQQQRLLPPTYQPIAADQYQYEQQMQGMEPQFAEPTQQLQMPGMGSLAGTTLKAGPMAGMAGPIAGGVMGAALLGKGLYDTYNNKQGDPFSRAQAGFSTMGASEAYRLGSKMFAGKTNRDQLQRDAVRNDLRSTGFIDNSYNVSLADGRKFDIGKDGSSKAYNVDFTKDGAKDAVGATQGLAAILAGSGKAKDDLAGYLANAAMSSGSITPTTPELCMLRLASTSKKPSMPQTKWLTRDRSITPPKQHIKTLLIRYLSALLKKGGNVTRTSS